MEYNIDNGRGRVWRHRDPKEGTVLWYYSRRLKDGTYSTGRPALTRMSAIDACWELVNE